VMPAMVKEADGSYTVQFPGSQFSAMISGIKNTAIKLLRRNVKFDPAARTLIVKDHAECDPALKPWACWNVWEKPTTAPNGSGLLITNGPEKATLDCSSPDISVGGAGNLWRMDADGSLGGRDADAAATQALVDAGKPFAWGCIHVPMPQTAPGVFDLTTTIQVQ